MVAIARFKFDRERLLTKLDLPPVIDFIESKVGIDLERVRTDVKFATVKSYSQAKNGQPKKVNTDLFPRGEYYLNAG